MVSFKLCVSDPSTSRTYQKEVKDNMAKPFIGLNIGETIKGDNFELPGYEFLITGGSDYCGFPMRKGILGLRKSLTIYRGIGFRGDAKGIKRRKTVCGHKIHERISQINLKVLKYGAKKLNEMFGETEKAGEKEKKKEEQVKTEVREPSSAPPLEKAEAKEQKEPKEHKTEKKEEKKAE